MSGHIFISYSRADEGFVDGLIDKLHQRGLAVWLDRNSIEGGAAWRAAISEAIRECQAFLVVLSPNSINSKNVSRELSMAESRNRLIVPIMYRQCDIPPSMEYQLTELQWIDFTEQSDEEAFRRLVRVLIRPNEGSASQAVEPSMPASTEQRVALTKPEAREAVGYVEKDNDHQYAEVERTEARILEPPRPAIRRVTTKVVVSERRLAEVNPESWIPETLAVSHDSQRVAYIVRVGGFLGFGEKHCVVVNGRAERTYSDITQTIRFSQDSERVAYGAQEGNKWMVVVDGKEGKKYDDLGSGDPIFSADGQRVAYGARVGDKWMVVVDGREGKKYDGVGSGDPTFSADGQRIVYGASEGGKWMVVVDGREGKKYDGVLSGTPIFSADGQRVVYGASEGDKWMVVVDGKEGRKYDGILSGTPIFSANGQRVAYGTHEGDKWMVVVDGKEGKKYDGVGGDLIFSADGQRIAYGASVGDNWMVVVDGKEGKKYDGVMSGTPIFSADGQRVVYGASVGDKWMVVVDGKEGKKYDGVLGGTPIFSADGRRVAYGAREGDRWMVVVDGEEGDAYSSIGELAFSPDGSRVATEVQVGDRWRVVVDGEGENTYDAMLRGGHITFDAADRLHWIAINGNEILLATARIE